MTDQALGCLEMMDFDGKQDIVQIIQNNGTMYQQIIALQQQIAQLQAVITGQYPQTANMQTASQPMPNTANVSNNGGDTSQLAKIFDNAAEGTIVNKARERAQNVTNISEE